MPAIRVSRTDQATMAVDDLVNIGSQSVGLSIARDTPDRVTVTRTGQRPWQATVHARRSLSPVEALALIAGQDRGDHIVVADQISTAAKDRLSQTPGWSWLDRRGELRLRRGSTDFEIRFPPVTPSVGTSAGRPLAAPASDGPIRGNAGVGYAAALLRDPDDPPSIRAVARLLGMAPSTVSDAAGHLREAGLVLTDGSPVLPDLFWALAAVWQPIHVSPVAEKPEPSRLTRHSLHLDDLTLLGWAQGGDEAAMAWGAPMLAVGSHPWLWVPDRTAARRAERTLRPASWKDFAAVIAVPPTSLVCTDRQPPPSPTLTWPTPHPLYIALDLARDRARGHQILEEWTPPSWVPRPWTNPI